jgi:hypothetical protein
MSEESSMEKSKKVVLVVGVALTEVSEHLLSHARQVLRSASDGEPHTGRRRGARGGARGTGGRRGPGARRDARRQTPIPHIGRYPDCPFPSPHRDHIAVEIEWDGCESYERVKPRPVGMLRPVRWQLPARQARPSLHEQRQARALPPSVLLLAMASPDLVEPDGEIRRLGTDCRRAVSQAWMAARARRSQSRQKVVQSSSKSSGARGPKSFTSRATWDRRVWASRTTSRKLTRSGSRSASRTCACWC